MKRLIIAFLFSCFIFISQAKEYHVSNVNGNDVNPGTLTLPFKTINHSAQIAHPGDTITVHEGVYREWVDPLYGGESDLKRILYRSAEGERVEIKGSEVLRKWKKVKGDVWCTTIETYSSLSEILFGDWLYNGSKIHRADLFIDNVSMYEVDSLDKVLNPQLLKSYRDPDGTKMLWYISSDSSAGSSTSTIYANFPSTDPNKSVTELSVRHTCFYPSREGINYITVRGFIFSQAATRWGAPTAEQVGMVGSHWGKGWIIENNVVENSKCIGISLGKEASTGNNLGRINGRVDGTHHYIEVIFNTLRKGWSKTNIGSHVVRNNIIRYCEQAGICGSMGGAFSEIYCNHIYSIWTKRQYSGGEIGGIKFHAPVDAYIHNNHIHGCWRGIWMDWMAQGVRISSNLLYENSEQDIYYEVTQGPYIIDNNLLLSDMSLHDKSASGAFVHNLIRGSIIRFSDGRNTPYMLNHSTEIKGYCSLVNGGHRFYNNIFFQDSLGLSRYNKADLPIFAKDNLIWEGEEFKLETKNGAVYLTCGAEPPSCGSAVTCERLQETAITGYRYENSDGTPFSVTKDFFGNDRSLESPIIGPFEINNSLINIKVADDNR